MMVRRRLKGMTRALFHHFGSLEAIAKLTNKSVAQLGRYQAIDEPDSIPVELVALLEAQDDVPPVMTAELAALNGHILVAVPRVKGEGTIVAQMGTLAREFGDVATKIGLALADGKITADEVQRLNIRQEIAQAMAALAGMDDLIKDIARE